MLLKCIILCVSFLVTGSIASVAPFIKPCRPTDSDCILKSAGEVVPHLIRGIKELGVQPLDPLNANDIAINSGGLVLALKKLVVTGLAKCKINKIERNPAKSSGVLDIQCPISCVGNYTASGRLLDLFDVFGDGPFELKGGELHAVVNFRLKQITKGDKKYYKISDFDFTYQPVSKFEFKLGNLYDGDEERAGPVLKVVNESWKEMVLDPNIGRPIIREAVGQIVKIINSLVTRVPIEEFEVPE